MARFHMDSLVTKTKRKDVRKALENLPSRLDESYDETIHRIESQPQEVSELAKRVLLWVCKSFRPLSFTEFQHALAVEPEMTEVDDDDIDDGDTLLSICAGLVVIDEEVRTLRFVHFTTQDYLERHSDALFGDPHAQITSSCLHYLGFNNFASGPCRNGDDIKERHEKTPFFEYASLYWPKHARSVSDFEQKAAKGLNICDLILRFLSKDGNVASFLQVIGRANPLRCVLEYSNIHVCAAFGLAQAVVALLRTGIPANSCTAGGYSPLILASGEGYETVVAVLLEQPEINIDSQMKFTTKDTALTCAASKDHTQVVYQLLKHGANPTLRSSHGTALDIAVRRQQEDIVNMLLSAKSNIRVNDADRNSAIMAAMSSSIPDTHAAQAKFERILNLLNQNDTQGIVQDRSRRTESLLHTAAITGNTTAVGWLLKHGLNPNTRNQRRETPLHIVVDLPESDSQALIARDLLRKGADPAASNIEGQTPLHRAAAGPANAVVLSIILECKMDINGRDNEHRTPLILAASPPSKYAINKCRLLIAEGANIGDKSISGRTALHQATLRDDADLIAFLLEKGAFIDVQDNRGCTPVHLTMLPGRSHDDIIMRPLVKSLQFLLNQGADPDIIDSSGRTAYDYGLRDGRAGAHHVMIQKKLAILQKHGKRRRLKNRRPEPATTARDTGSNDTSPSSTVKYVVPPYYYPSLLK